MTSGTDWADQARRLLDAVRGASGGASDAASDGSEHPSGECAWCPHCQVRALLRGDRPDVAAALTDVLTTAAAALRTFAGEHAPPPPADEEQPVHRDPAPVVQRIEIA